MAEERSAPRLEIIQRRVLDVADTKLVRERSYVPAFDYIPSVSPSGQIALIRHTNLGYEWSTAVDSRRYGELFRDIMTRSDRDYAQVSLLLDGTGEGWQTVTLKGAGPYLLFDEPRVLFDSDGGVYLVWVERTIEQDKWTSRLVARRWPLHDEGFPPLILSGTDRSSVLSFDGTVVSGSDLEVLWTADPDNERLRTRSAGPQSRVYARRLSASALGSIQRISPKRGKYDADRVKVVADVNGDIYAVWDQSSSKAGAQLFLAVRHAGEWSEAMQVSDDQPAWTKGAADSTEEYPIPMLHVDFALASPTAGTVVVVWSSPGRTPGIYTRVYSEGRLDAIDLVSAGGVNVRAASSRDGAVHVVYQDLKDDDAAKMRDRYAKLQIHHKYAINYRRWRAGDWSAEEAVASSVFRDTSRIHVDSQGRIHLFWQELQDGNAALIHGVARYSSTH
jgi:hypothetical protein